MFWKNHTKGWTAKKNSDEEERERILQHMIKGGINSAERYAKAMMWLIGFGGFTALMGVLLAHLEFHWLIETIVFVVVFWFASSITRRNVTGNMWESDMFDIAAGILSRARDKQGAERRAWLSILQEFPDIVDRAKNYAHEIHDDIEERRK